MSVIGDTLSAGKVSLSVIPDTKGFGKLLTGALSGEEGNWNKIGVKLGKKLVEGAGVALVGTAALASKMAVDMSASNAMLQGQAQLTAKAATAIGDAFLHTAGQSTFSGKAMQDAFAPVGGVIQTLTGRTLTAADALKTMKIATTLAEASGQNLNSTTANLVRIMQSFHIGLTGAADASNYLFNASRVTGVGVDELTGSVVKLHGKLGIASPSLKDLSSLIVDLAQHGLTGSRSLMMVSAGLGTLLGGSKATTEALKILNVHVYDSNGKFVGMQSVLEQLTPKLSGMTDQQRRMAESMLFGKGAAAALDSTIMAGAAGLGKATAAVVTKNAVDKAAEAQTKSYEGVVKMLKSTYEDFMIMLGQKIIPILQNVVTWMTKHKAIVIGVAAVIGGVLLAATIAWGVSLFTVGGALAFITWPIVTIVGLIALFAAGIIYTYNHVKIFKTVVDDVWKWLKGAVVVTINFVKDHWQLILAALTGPIGLAVLAITKHWDAIKHGFIVMLNALIKAWNFLPWHKDIKLLTDTELPALAAAATKTAATIAALKNGTTHPGGLTSSAPTVAAIKASIPSVTPSSSSSIPDFSGAVTTLTGAKKALSEHAKIAAKLVADHLKATKIYGQMNTVIKDALVKKTDLIKAAGLRDAASQATYDDASFKLHRTFNDDKFKLDRDYADQKDKLNRSYNDSIAAAQKSYDDSETVDKQKHLDALKQLEDAYNDKVTQLTQAAADKRQSIVQKSIDLLTGTFSSAVSVDVGKLFDPATGVGGMLDSLKTKLTGAKDLSSNAAALAAQGYSQTFIQQVVAQGPDVGNAMSKSILAATPEAASQMKDLFSQIQDVSDNGVTALATSMNSGTKLATKALMDEYAQVGTDLQVSLAQEYAAFTDANAKENASYTATMAASLKTLNDAKAAALLTLNQGLADAKTSYDNSLFDMNTTLINGLFDANDVLQKALKASADQFNTDMDTLQTDTMTKMTALKASLQAVADAIAKISGASAGAAVMAKVPAVPVIVPKVVAPGSLDSATAQARTDAVNSAVYVPQSTYDSQVPAAARPATSADIAALSASFKQSLADQARLQQQLTRAG
jgi:TP901 family phage tail tape measure protein